MLLLFIIVSEAPVSCATANSFVLFSTAAAIGPDELCLPALIYNFVMSVLHCNGSSKRDGVNTDESVVL